MWGLRFEATVNTTTTETSYPKTKHRGKQVPTIAFVRPERHRPGYEIG